MAVHMLIFFLGESWRRSEKLSLETFNFKSQTANRGLTFAVNAPNVYLKLF